MAQQMSPPPQGAFSPYQSNPSSGLNSPGGFALPPSKRPRLSPNPITNPASPSVPYLHLPNASTPPLPFHAPQPLNDMAQRAGHGSMGPPQLPVQKAERADKSTDINDLSDIISAAGIDVREEENYLAETYRNQHQPSSFSTSFNTQSSSTISPNNSFGTYPQGIHGAYGTYQGPGPVSQPPVPQKTVEEEIYEKHKQAARVRAESKQQHLRDPFLTANVVRHRLHAKAYENGVKLNVEGLFDKLPEKPQVNSVTATGPDGTGLVAMRASGLLTENAPLVDVLSLISLAANERLRSLLEDAVALSRGRQVGSHGIVPPEWSSLATGTGPPELATAVPLSVTKTAWDQPDNAVSPTTVLPQKRAHDSSAAINRLPTPPTEPPSTPVPTISFHNPTPVNLRKLITRDRQLEEARIAARAKRQKAAQAASDSPATPGTPLPSERAPEVKMTKKERDRLAKAGQTDEVLHKQSNATAAMALGGLGGKKYSWLTGGAAGKPAGSGIGTGAGIGPGRINTAVGGPSANKPDGGNTGPAQDRGLIARDRRYGDWREDGPKGKGVQIRDWIEALEADGKETKSLVKALSRLKSVEL